jgi:C1A family cysteine protease
MSGTGYDIRKHGEADNEALSADGVAFSYAAADGNQHTEFDPTPHLHIENQGSRPSCVGHAVTTVCEMIAGLQVGRWDEMPALSRLFAWRAGQELWQGRFDPNEGCTIAHGVRSAQQTGVCLESYAPYDGGDTLSQEAYANAAWHRAQKQTGLETADDCRRFLDGGFGGIVAGVNWTTAMSNCGGRMTRQQVDERNRSVGGHAVAIVGFDAAGNFLLVNSWGRKWGDNGIARVEPAAIDYLLGRPYTVMRGVTDLTNFDRVRVLESWGMGV